MEMRVTSEYFKWISNGEWNEERIQYLEQKVTRKFTFFGLFPKSYWKIIDSEKVPSFVWLQAAIFGDQQTGWRSKFSQYMTKNKSQ